MPPADDADPFAGAEKHYARYRPGYSDAVIRYLIDRFGIDEDARVLDLGCGTGELAIPLAREAGDVVGMDPNERMLERARERADAAGLETVRWRVGSDADLADDLGPFDLTTLGRSFHWMDQARTLERLYRVSVPGGGIAILTDTEWLTHGERDWQRAVYEIASDYIDDLPEHVPASEVEYDDPWDERIAAAGFVDVDTSVIETERTWWLDAIVGYVLSLSFSSPAMLGDRTAAFERDVRERLGSDDRDAFTQPVEERIITGRVPATVPHE